MTPGVCFLLFVRFVVSCAFDQRSFFHLYVCLMVVRQFVCLFRAFSHGKLAKLYGRLGYILLVIYSILWTYMVSDYLCIFVPFHSLLCCQLLAAQSSWSLNDKHGICSIRFLEPTVALLVKYIELYIFTKTCSFLYWVKGDMWSPAITMWSSRSTKTSTTIKRGGSAPC